MKKDKNHKNLYPDLDFHMVITISKVNPDFVLIIL